MTSETLQKRKHRASTVSRRLRSAVGPPVMVACVLATLAGAATAGETTTPPVGEMRIEIVSPASSWDNLSELFLGTTPAAPFGDGSVFVMRGSLRNTGDHPVHHIVLRYELLDENGKVVHDAEGYNRNAESMRADEDGKVHEELVTPIPAGGVDSYRMVFFHDEVPRFASQRVRVVEVHDQDAEPPAASALPAAVKAVPAPAAVKTTPLPAGAKAAPLKEAPGQ